MNQNTNVFSTIRLHLECGNFSDGGDECSVFVPVAGRLMQITSVEELNRLKECERESLRYLLEIGIDDLNKLLESK